ERAAKAVWVDHDRFGTADLAMRVVGRLGPRWTSPHDSVVFTLEIGDRRGSVTVVPYGSEAIEVLRALRDDGPVAATRTKASYHGADRLVAPRDLSVLGRPAWTGSIGTEVVLLVDGDPGIAVFMGTDGTGLRADDLPT